jgi:hypothetical protein
MTGVLERNFPWLAGKDAAWAIEDADVTRKMSIYWQ